MQFAASASAVFGGMKSRSYAAAEDGRFPAGVAYTVLFLTPDDPADPWIVCQVRSKDQPNVVPTLSELTLGEKVTITVDPTKYKQNDLPAVKTLVRAS